MFDILVELQDGKRWLGDTETQLLVDDLLDHWSQATKGLAPALREVACRTEEEVASYSPLRRLFFSLQEK